MKINRFAKNELYNIISKERKHMNASTSLRQHLDNEWDQLSPQHLRTFAIPGTAATTVVANDFRAQTRRTLHGETSLSSNPLSEWEDYPTE